ncbi:Cytochrome P450 9e2 [Gryllus bimaculatus]|nr:Cytochrome P450 9e2 [Gryllus bimaculatus]
MLRISLLDAKAEKYFSSLIRETIKVREEHNIVRPDMIHLLMQAKKGNLKVDPHEEDQYHFQRKNISDDLIIGQAVIFFFAGFDTISSVLSFVCYYLAMNVDVQKKLQEEIRSQIGEDAKKLTYEDIQKMKYLHMVISGMRFALMEAKIALIYLLANFDICRVEKTPEKVVFEKSFNLAIEGGFWVGLTPRKTIEIEK